MLNADALKVAHDVIEILKPACLRIEVMGSIRRLASHVKDIDILAVPDLTVPAPLPLEFGKPVPPVHKTMLDRILWEHSCRNENPVGKWKLTGSDFTRTKRELYVNVNIKIEIWQVFPPEQWGVKAVIRTGPSDFSHWMVTTRSKGGALPDEYIVEDSVVGKRVRGSSGFKREGEITMPEEIDFFKLCGLNYIEPHERIAKWRK